MDSLLGEIDRSNGSKRKLAFLCALRWVFDSDLSSSDDRIEMCPFVDAKERERSRGAEGSRKKKKKTKSASSEKRETDVDDAHLFFLTSTRFSATTPSLSPFEAPLESSNECLCYKSSARARERTSSWQQ